MAKQYSALRWGLALAVLLVVAGCGDGDGPAAFQPQPTDDSSDQPGDSEPATDLSPTDSATGQSVPDFGVEIVENCEPPATEIAVGTSVDDEIVAGDQAPLPRQFYCVVVSSGAAQVLFELGGMIVDLDLFVAYGDLETVQSGGVAFWSSLTGGLDDEVVVVDPALVRGELGGFEPLETVTPGAYYIEVSGVDFNESSPFTLTVTPT